MIFAEGGGELDILHYHGQELADCLNDEKAYRIVQRILRYCVKRYESKGYSQQDALALVSENAGIGKFPFKLWCGEKSSLPFAKVLRLINLRNRLAGELRAAGIDPVLLIPISAFTTRKMKDMQRNLYAFRNSDTGKVKVGISDDLDRRMDEFRRGSGSDIEVLASAPGTMADESALHSALSQWRLTGEWFDGSPEFINEMQRQFQALNSREAA